MSMSRKTPSSPRTPATNRSDGNRKPPAGRPTGRGGGRGKQQPSSVPLVIGAIVVTVGVVVALVIIMGGGKSGSGALAVHHDSATQLLAGVAGPEGIPLEQGAVLAPAPAGSTGPVVDGISCDPSEQAVYHVHTHLSVFVNGVLRPLPPGIGIVQPVAAQSGGVPFYSASQCYYWLHVHAQDGIIHIESPTVQTYTLGQFFDLWGQPLGAGRVATEGGNITVYVDGTLYTGDPRGIRLGSREDIQIDVGTVVPPMRVDWSKSQL